MVRSKRSGKHDLIVVGLALCVLFLLFVLIAPPVGQKLGHLGLLKDLQRIFAEGVTAAEAESASVSGSGITVGVDQDASGGGYIEFTK